MSCENKTKPLICSRSIKYLDCDKREIEPPKKYVISNRFVQDGFGSRERDAYRYVPWVKESVSRIIIKPLNADAAALTSRADRNGFYRPNKKYYEVQASRVPRRQEGEVLYLDVYVLTVAFVTRGGRIMVQNEDVFACETKYVNSMRRYGSRHVEGYSDAVRSYAEHLLASACPNGEYVRAVVDEYERLYSHDPHVFIDNMSDLIAVLTNSDGHLASKFHGCDVLPSAVPLLASGHTDDDVAAVVVDRNRREIKREWLRFLSSGRRSANTAPAAHSSVRVVDIPVWRDMCKNWRDLGSTADDDLVFIEDSDALYGFRIDDMYDIVKTTGRNPYTDAPLDRAFVQRFADTYARPSRPPQSGHVTVLERLLDEYLTEREHPTVVQ